MKSITAIIITTLGLSIHAQQLETYDTGAYSEIFHTNAAAIFSFANGQGFFGTRAIQPGNTMYALNYLRRGPLNLSTANAYLEISTMFKVIKPTSTNLGTSTLQIGFCKSQSPTSFISPGASGGISWWLQPKSLIDTGNGFHFDTTIHIAVYNGSSSSGFSWGVFGNTILKSNNWYKATLQISRVNSATLSVWGAIDDYGSTGQTYLSRVDTVGTDTAMGDAQFPFTPLTSDSTMYPAIGGMSSGGLRVTDQTIMTGNLSPDLATDIELAVKLDFASQAGVNYYIHNSADLVQWKSIEGPIAGTGGLITRYFSAGLTRQFFRVTPE